MFLGIYMYMKCGEVKSDTHTHKEQCMSQAIYTMKNRRFTDLHVYETYIYILYLEETYP